MITDVFAEILMDFRGLMEDEALVKEMKWEEYVYIYIYTHFNQL